MTSSKSLHRKSIANSASIGQLTSKDLETLAEDDEPGSPTKSPAKVAGMLRSKSSDSQAGARRGTGGPEGEGLGLTRAGSSRSKRAASPGIQSIAEEDAAEATVNGSLEPGPAPDQTESETQSPTPGIVTAYLQVGRSVKKVTIETDGLSFASLRVLFVDRFSYSPGQENFPAIYIRDPKSDIQYELEDISEIRDGCLLSLNIERESDLGLSNALWSNASHHSTGSGQAAHRHADGQLEQRHQGSQGGCQLAEPTIRHTSSIRGRLAQRHLYSTTT